MQRRLFGVLACLLLLAAVPTAQAGETAGIAIAYPSSQTLAAGQPLPPGGRASITINAARGDHEGAWVVVRAGKEPVAASIDRGSLGGIDVAVDWGHFVDFGSRRLPDALLPWDGGSRSPEEERQALFLRIAVPRTTPPGKYDGSIRVSAGARTATLPLTVRVFPVTLPVAGTLGATLHTSFHVNPQAYVNTVARLFGLGSGDDRRAASAALYRFLASYGISPASWGFGEPRSPAGYAGSGKWWLDSAANMVTHVPRDPGFGAMRIPVSNNRTASRNWIAGLDPARPEAWCSYLRAVRSFWGERGWLNGTLQYLYGQDEPSRAGQRLVARQAKVVHECWPGARTLMTGNPGRDNAYLWDGKSNDDVDIWTVLARRYYGQFTVPRLRAAGRNRSREFLSQIARVPSRADVWSYTYSGVPGTPGFSAAEPLANPRLLLLWNALEGIGGLLYGQGTTNYGSNPLSAVDHDGEFVLLYPGARGPVPSARLEQIRDGIEEWAIFDAIRRRSGPGEVRAILGGAGLFSANKERVRLACRLGCELRSATKYSWPWWSRDAGTVARIEAARVTALTRASAAR